MALDFSTVTGERVRADHQRLFDEFRENADTLCTNRDLLAKFLNDVDQLLEEMKQLNQDMQRAEEFDWLNTAAMDWQIVFSSRLRIPRDIRREVGIQVPSRTLEPTRRILPDEQIQQHLKDKAYLVGQFRKLAALARRLEELNAYRDRIHEEIVSSPEEAERDWHDAHVHFASEVLDAEIFFPYQIGPESYHRLENIWLEDVKRMRAYLIWERRNDGWSPEAELPNYLSACEQLRSKLLDESLKASPASFEDVKSYLNATYLRAGRLDTSPGQPGWELVRAKARRIWQRSGQPAGQDERIWAAADAYCQAFYENIIKAVVEDLPEAVAAVVNAFRICRNFGHNYPIVNCFEAALTIYYLKPSTVQRCCQDTGRLL